MLNAIAENLITKSGLFVPYLIVIGGDSWHVALESIEREWIILKFGAKDMVNVFLLNEFFEFLNEFLRHAIRIVDIEPFKNGYAIHDGSFDMEH